MNLTLVFSRKYKWLEHYFYVWCFGNSQKLLATNQFLDVEKVLVSYKISFSEKNYKYFIGYLHDDYKVKPLHIVPLKTSAYVKRYDGQTKWMDFFN